ncbi:hypothetical protein MKW98_006335 [Papaver atlanticum]|uniref:Invertase inhibitor n=1 Tax=Papaver atlanticum TaxID=357466 RepID=A0AAD4TH79_9MAGN|nr:hypothetical protein MKW98_006335 [Papaver atlanticum]
MSQSVLSLFSIFIVFLVVLNSFHGVYGDLISHVCKEASTYPDFATYDFCVASLLAHPAKLYSDAIDKVQKAVANFKVQAYEGAILDMTDAKTDVYTCEDGFTEGHHKLVSLLTKQAGYFRGLGHISLVIITDMVI